MCSVCPDAYIKVLILPSLRSSPSHQSVFQTANTSNSHSINFRISNPKTPPTKINMLFQNILAILAFSAAAIAAPTGDDSCGGNNGGDKGGEGGKGGKGGKGGQTTTAATATSTAGQTPAQQAASNCGSNQTLQCCDSVQKQSGLGGLIPIQVGINCVPINREYSRLAPAPSDMQRS